MGCEKRLGVKFDQRLTFDDQISDLWKKASRKIHAFAIIKLCMNSPERVNRLHGCCLRIICHGQESSFEELLEEDGSDSIHN